MTGVIGMNQFLCKWRLRLKIRLIFGHGEPLHAKELRCEKFSDLGGNLPDGHLVCRLNLFNFVSCDFHPGFKGTLAMQVQAHF